MSAQDSIRDLQAAARAAADRCAHQAATRVLVLGADDRLLVNVAVPAAPGPNGAIPTAPPVVSGWAVNGQGAAFDGAPVPVAPSRLKLLRVLAEAEGPMGAEELAAAAFRLESETDLANTHYHLRELRKELRRAFTLGGDVLREEEGGYRLVLR